MQAGQQARTRSVLGGYVIAAALVALVVIVQWPWRDVAGPAAPISLLLVAVALSAYLGGSAPGLVATGLGALCTLFFFIEPRQSFRTERPADLLFLIVFMGVGSLISLLSGALYRSRERRGAILSSIADAYYAIDHNGRLLDLNDRAAAYFGRSRDELVGQNLWTLFPRDAESEIGLQYRRAIERGEPAHFETRSSTGADQWVEIRAYPSRDGLGVFLADVTARKRSVQELRRQRDLTRAITDNAAESLFLMDAQGRVTFVNPAAEATFGWKGDELLGKVLHEVLHHQTPDGHPLPMAECPLGRVFETGQPLRSHEDVFFRRDGSAIHVACSNAPIREGDKVIGAVLVVHDISQRVRVEQALRGSEARLAAIFNQAGVGIAQTDLQGRYILVNQRYCELVGRSTAELLGMQVDEVTHPDDLAAHLETRDDMAAGGPLRVIEKRYMRPDGTLVWADASVTVVHDKQGRAQSLLAVVQDVTDRKRSEVELREAKDAAEKAREAAEAANEAKDRFLAVLSHELRTPLTPVLTAVQMLERDATVAPEVRESLSMIRRNVELEARLIDDLLDLNRITHGKLQLNFVVTKLHEKLRSVAAICDSDARAKGVRLTMRLEAPRQDVRGDPARLQQVFWNLLKNAIKFTPEGGAVEVVTHATEDQIRVEVRDTGVGIDSDVLPRIFEAFEQGNRAVTRVFGGLGLGLAISRALVEMHGGAISAQSEGRDRGACFTVTLPLEPVMPEVVTVVPPGGAAGVPDAGDLAGARILLIEDDVDSARILARLLRRSGAAVQTADSVATGLQAALAGDHDLLISDIGLPDGSGLDLMRQLMAARGLGVRAIALSGFGMEEDILRSREAGFTEHLTKPVNLARLEDTIRRVLRVPDATGG